MSGSNLTGKTKIVGLIGYPVSHSVSPPMHNAAFAHLGLDWCYVPLPVPTEPRRALAKQWPACVHWGWPAATSPCRTNKT
ncbi:MAG: hypothetical protein R2911_07765 [Caldilineaceae bacterium]